jgi:hypothetical protein
MSDCTNIKHIKACLEYYLEVGLYNLYLENS